MHDYRKLLVGTHFINSKDSLPLLDVNLRDILEIPPPITEENKDRYLAELSKISEAENWVEKHSVENQSAYDVNKSEQHRDAKTTSKEEPATWYVVIIDILLTLLLFFGLPAFGVLLFG